jgi:hypothetical protein
VYSAEEVQAVGHKWHNTCFNCKTCKTGLNSQTLADKDNEIYCQRCADRRRCLATDTGSLAAATASSLDPRFALLIVSGFVLNVVCTVLRATVSAVARRS